MLERLAPRAGEVIVDVGCGSGRLTALLAERIGDGLVLAVDRSLAMLRESRTTLRGRRASLVLADALALPLRECADAVFSTATFHWVLDHPRLLAELHRVLRHDGRLVAQCGGGGNLRRLHDRALQVVATDEFAPHASAWVDPWEYADDAVTARRLAGAGFVDIETWLSDAPTTFTDAATYTEFVRTVVLRVHLARLPDETLRGRFLEVMAALASEDDPPFCLDYRRLNMVARKP